MSDVLAHDLPIGLRRIVAERREQMDLHGYDPTNDDSYTGGELMMAANAYLLAALFPNSNPSTASVVWPWDDEAFKPAEDPRKNLMKAGALIAAELDRLYRKEHRNG